MGLIYAISNRENGKMYIGQTVRTLEKRWYFHCSDKHIDHIHNAIRKYGVDAFIIGVIEEDVTNELLNEREIFWIAHYNTFHNGYNLTKGGDGFKGNHTDEAKEKIRQTSLGRRHGDEAKRKLRELHMGNTINVGRHHTEESKARMRKPKPDKKGKPWSEARRLAQANR